MLVIFVAFTIVAAGLAIASIAVFHECDWRKRLRNAVVVEGIVIAERNEHNWENTRAEIEYHLDGHTHRFVSKYGTGMLTVGHRVRVVVNANNGDCERLAFTTRWFFTVAPLILGGLFVLFGLSVARQCSG